MIIYKNDCRKKMVNFWLMEITNSNVMCVIACCVRKRFQSKSHFEISLPSACPNWTGAGRRKIAFFEKLTRCFIYEPNVRPLLGLSNAL